MRNAERLFDGENTLLRETKIYPQSFQQKYRISGDRKEYDNENMTWLTFNGSKQIIITDFFHL